MLLAKFLTRLKPNYAAAVCRQPLDQLDRAKQKKSEDSDPQSTDSLTPPLGQLDDFDQQLSMDSILPLSRCEFGLHIFLDLNDSGLIVRNSEDRGH